MICRSRPKKLYVTYSSAGAYIYEERESSHSRHLDRSRGLRESKNNSNGYCNCVSGERNLLKYCIFKSVIKVYIHNYKKQIGA